MNLSESGKLACLAGLLVFSAWAAPGRAQTAGNTITNVSKPGLPDAGLDRADSGRAAGDSTPFLESFSGPTAGGLSNGADAEAGVPAAPEPSGRGGNPQREGVPWAAEWHQQPFSRIGVGADVSPLGIGIKGAVILDEYLDARVDMNFFGFTSGRFEIDGINVNGNIHMASSGAKVDLYPWNSIWRVSGGLMMFDGNRASAVAGVAPGTSFKLNNVTYYSSNADPLTGTGLLTFDTVKPAPLFSFGFGRFIPRSNRHWSFPTEFGVIYTGAPSLTVTTAGAVCTDKAQTHCSDISDPSNPVGAAFNSNLQAQLAKWRKDFNKVQVYPIFSYSVVYSFNIR